MFWVYGESRQLPGTGLSLRSVAGLEDVLDESCGGDVEDELAPEFDDNPGTSVDLGELQQAVGRFQFSFEVLVYDRPFLAPMYTLLGAYGNEGQLELLPFVLAAMHWIKRRLLAGRPVPCGRIIKNSEAIFRVDAKAINKDVSIGGWEPHYEPDGSAAKHKSRWFACKLTPSTPPWAYCKDFHSRPFLLLS